MRPSAAMAVSRALGDSASPHACADRVTRAATESAIRTVRSRDERFSTTTSMTTAVRRGAQTVVVVMPQSSTTAERTTRSGRHACVTGTPNDVKRRPSTKSAAV